MSYVYDLRELNFIVCLSVCLTAERHLESSLVVQELELAMNLALHGLL